MRLELTHRVVLGQVSVALVAVALLKATQHWGLSEWGTLPPVAVLCVSLGWLLSRRIAVKMIHEDV